MPAQMRGENLAAGFNGFFLGHIRKTPAIPGFGQTFHNEGRGVVVKLIDMGPDPAVLGLLEDEGESIVEFGMCAQPDEFAQPCINVGTEYLFIFAAHGRIYAIGGHDNVVVLAIVLGVGELGFKLHVHAQFPSAGLQENQHLLAPDPCKAMPARHRAHSVMHNGDIIPIGEVTANRVGALGVVLLHPA